VYARRTNLNFLSSFGDFLVENEGTVMQQIVACGAVLRQEGIDEVRPATHWAGSSGGDCNPLSPKLR